MDVVYISDSDNEMLDASLQASSYDISSDDFQSPTKKPRISEAADHKQDIKSINIPNKAESDNGDDNGDGNDDSDDDDDHGEGDDDDSDDDDEDMFETVPTTASIEETEKGEDSVDNDALSDDSMPELGTVELTVGDTATDVLAPKRRRPIVTKSAREIRRQQHKIELVCKLVSSLAYDASRYATCSHF
ncbi:hypothetical protein GGI12_003394 [Dipsacomyces acuminosporus]|nr:hypothetical protein GGI12_003394 [Dipsacomyces acuminosporus]